MSKRVVHMLIAFLIGICLFSACGNMNSKPSSQENSKQKMTSEEETTPSKTFVTETTKTEETLLTVKDSLSDEDIKSRLEAGEIVEIESGTAIDLRGDDNPDVFALNVDHENNTYTLQVNELEKTAQMPKNVWISETIYLVQIKGRILNNESVIVISGESDTGRDTLTFYIHDISIEQLVELGTIETSDGGQKDWFVKKDGVINTLCIMTSSPIWPWCYYYQEYIVAEGSDYALARVPDDMYPVGMVVSSQISISIYEARYSDATSWTIAPGESVILSATDNLDFIYVESLDGSKDGWLRIEGSGILIGGTLSSMQDVFTGMWAAD